MELTRFNGYSNMIRKHSTSTEMLEFKSKNMTVKSRFAKKDLPTGVTVVCQIQTLLDISESTAVYWLHSPMKMTLERISPT
mmetsp:Transcript_6610/g.16104  ORF Transcript_6610/g.16104 Transcript_6610/m.16104 type:complete len:81 (-) Transcript_6610:31-273(-)